MAAMAAALFLTGCNQPAGMPAAATPSRSANTLH